MNKPSRVPIVRILVLVLLEAGIIGCTANSGLSYVALSARVTHEDGSAVASMPSGSCTTLPVLLGSIIEVRRAVEDPLVLVLLATRDAVDVDFEGTRTDASFGRTISADQLQSSYSEQFVVESATGGKYIVSIAAGCM